MATRPQSKLAPWRTPLSLGTSVTILDKKPVGVGMVSGFTGRSGYYLIDEVINKKIIRRPIWRRDLKRRNQAYNEKNPSLKWLQQNSPLFKAAQIPEPSSEITMKKNQAGFCKNCGVALVGDDDGHCTECGTPLMYAASAPQFSASAPEFSAKAPENKAQKPLYRVEMACGVCRTRRVAVISADNEEAAKSWLDDAIAKRNEQRNHKHYTSRDVEEASPGSMESDWKKVDY